jgi:hypothetical protein
MFSVRTAMDVCIGEFILMDRAEAATIGTFCHLAI